VGRATNVTRVAWGLAIVAAVLVPCVGRAQPTPAEGASEQDRAAEAAHAAAEGKALFDQGLYDGAIERYEASFAIVPTAEVQFAIAEAYRAKGDTANAVRAYNLYKALNEPKPSAANASAGGGANAATGEVGAPARDENANPELIDASQLPPRTLPPRPVLPRSLVERKLLVPAQVNEGTIGTAVGHQTFRQSSGGRGSWSYVAVSLGGRIGFAAGELSADVVAVAVHDDPANGSVDVPIAQRMAAAMTFRIDDDTGVGPRVVGAALDSEYSGYAPGLFFEHKMRNSDTGAIVVAGTVSYFMQNLLYEDARGISAGGSVAFQLQVQPSVAVEALGELAGAWNLFGSTRGIRSQLLYAYGADLVVAVSAHFDFIPFFVAAPIGDTDTYAGGVRLTWH
jgi:hypothetical protein